VFNTLYWTARHASIVSILINYNIIQSALEEGYSYMMNMLQRPYSGMVSKMDDFDVYPIFSAAEQLSS